MKTLTKPIISLTIANLFVSCSLWQTRAPVFPSFGHLPNFAYSNALNGDLTLLRPKSLSVLGSYKADFKRNLRAKLEEKLGQSVNIGRHAAILEKKGSATINYHPGTLIQEPTILKAEIERVSSCPLPELDTSQKNLIQRGTLTEAIDWKIFVTCTLKSWHLMDLSQDLDKDEERQLFQAYPPIQPTNSYHDAFEFIIVSVLTSLYQNTGAGLSPDEQLGFFERVFLVTKLRTLTQLEKTSVEENLRRHGLYVPLKNYILNWYISNTYFKYFNYSKNPDGGYKAARLWGMIQDSSGQPATGASYRLIDANISGHALSGKTGGRQTRLNRLRILLPKEETRYARLTGTSPSTFAYNMELQFYLPIEQFKKDMAGEVTSATITPHPTVSVLVEAPERISMIRKIELKHRFTHDASIMIPETKVINFTPIPYTQSTSPLVIGEVQGSFQKIRYHFKGRVFDTVRIDGNTFRFRLQLPASKHITFHEVEVEIIADQQTRFLQSLQFNFYPKYVPERMLLRFKDETIQPVVDRVISRLNGSIIHHIWKRVYVVGLPQDSDVMAKMAEAERQSRVMYAGPISISLPTRRL